jgi:lipoprotein-releasing system permease protein
MTRAPAGVRGRLGFPSRLELRVAFRYLRSRRSSWLASLATFIAVGGVAVGVMALIVVLGVMNGLTNDLRDRILVGSPHLRVLTFGAGLRVDDWEDAIDVIVQDPDVLAAAPEILTESVVSAGADFAEGVMIQSLETETAAQGVTDLAQSVTRGSLDFEPTRDDVQGAVLLGHRLADRLAVLPGDRVSLVSPKPKVSAATGLAQADYWFFEVVGILNTGMYQYDNKLVVMPRPLAQQFAGLGNAVSAINVRVRDPWQSNLVGARLEEALGYPYRSVDWQRQNAALFSALKLEKLGMGLIIFFIMIVAASNIVGTLTMIVAEKTREIGILRAMGFTGSAIGRVFLAQGAVVGLVGVLLGLLGGLGVAGAVDRWRWIKIDPEVYLIDHLPVHIEVADVSVVVIASLVLAVLATIYPSRSAGRLAPVEAIRHE